MDLEHHLRKICLRYSTWTNVMQEYFKSEDDAATSNRAETHFSILKQNLQRMGVHTFILQHLDMIESDVTSAKARLENDYLALLNDLYSKKLFTWEKVNNIINDISILFEVSYEKFYSERKK